MKLITALLSLAVIVASQAVDAAKSKHSFDFREFAQEVAATKAEQKSQRKLHNQIVQGRKHVQVRSDDLDEVLFSTECEPFTLRMIELYPELYYEDLLDVGLFACNPLSYQLMLTHYTAGVNQTAEEGEPQLCIDTFSSLMLEVVESLEELHYDEAFCDYATYYASSCSSINITDVEEALLDPWTPEEVTDVCTTGEAIEVALAFFFAIIGPYEEDRCRYSMKQLIVDNQVDFNTLADNDQVCIALLESLEAESEEPRSAARGKEEPHLGCLAQNVCL